MLDHVRVSPPPTHLKHISYFESDDVKYPCLFFIQSLEKNPPRTIEGN